VAAKVTVSKRSLVQAIGLITDRQYDAPFMIGFIKERGHPLLEHLTHQIFRRRPHQFA
jgi:hypothetical protein